MGHDYRLRLICPHGDFDKWVMKENLELTLQQVYETFWDFECPTHGLQREKPFEACKKNIYRRGQH